MIPALSETSTKLCAWLLGPAKSTSIVAIPATKLKATDFLIAQRNRPPRWLRSRVRIFMCFVFSPVFYGFPVGSFQKVFQNEIHGAVWFFSWLLYAIIKRGTARVV
jgi:hypothetical protein